MEEDAFNDVVVAYAASVGVALDDGDDDERSSGEKAVRGGASQLDQWGLTQARGRPCPMQGLALKSAAGDDLSGTVGCVLVDALVQAVQLTKRHFLGRFRVVAFTTGPAWPNALLVQPATGRGQSNGRN